MGTGRLKRAGRKMDPISKRLRQGDLEPTGPSLTVVMPAHNEERTIASAVEEILAVNLGSRLQLVVVDDGSRDGTSSILESFADPRLTVRRHEVNQGKGAAVLTGVALAECSHVVVFDADSEYEATDLVRMFQTIVIGQADVVYGARLFGSHTLYPSFRYAMGNRLTTFVANLIFDSYLTDLHTCLKMLPTELFRSLELTETGFGLDSEITGEVLRRGYRPFEVPISYVGRTRGEGKKITARDGIECLRVLVRVRLRGRMDLQPTGRVSRKVAPNHPSLHALGQLPWRGVDRRRNSDQASRALLEVNGMSERRKSGRSVADDGSREEASA